MHLLDIKATGFRNLATETVTWNRHANLVWGANGEGKTNLLEAVSVLGNLRSFRTASMRQVATHGQSEFLIEGRVESAAGVVRFGQQVMPGPPIRRRLSMAGAAAETAQYLQLCPVVALSGADRELVAGGPGPRRAFLDRFVFLLEPDYYDELRLYRKLLRQRNAALVGMAGDREMGVWENRLAAAAAVLVTRRRQMSERLERAFLEIYEELRGPAFPDISAEYRGEATLDPAEKVSKVEEYYRKRYNETRTRDRRTGFTGEGPHRHDLGLRTNGKTVRHTLSSGQVKMVAAALRLASLKQVERERGELLPVIIDDVDAELDAAVLSRLIAHLGGGRQLFLSSADGGLSARLEAGSSRYEIRRGAVLEVAGERE